MPWKTETLNQLEAKVRTLIQEQFEIDFNVRIWVCDELEMENAVIDELKAQQISPQRIAYFKSNFIPFIIGKFFRQSNQILLIQGKGEIISVLLHEILHSIQRCAPHRENIVDYIVFRILHKRNEIAENIIHDWEELEKIHGFEKIKARLIHTGDCEDF